MGQAPVPGGRQKRMYGVLKRVSLPSLIITRAVRDFGGYRLAGRVLGLSPGAAKTSVHRLEKVLGEPLFVRGPQGVLSIAETDLALSIWGLIDEICGPAERLPQLLEDSYEYIGTRPPARLGCYVAHVALFAADALTAWNGGEHDLAWQLAHTNESVRGFRGNHLRSLYDQQQLEMAVLRRPDPDSPPMSGVTIPLYGWHLCLLPTPQAPGAAGEEIDISELESLEVLCSPHEHTTRDRFEELCAANGFSPQVVFDSASFDVLYALNRSGFAGLVTASDALPPELRREARRIVRDGQTLAEGSFDLCYRSDLEYRYRYNLAEVQGGIEEFATTLKRLVGQAGLDPA